MQNDELKKPNARKDAPVRGEYGASMASEEEGILSG
jgi:hypothetical protein